ncbi:hypothetical protein KHQ89_05540 [Mycoplasmatota bacterium]|nr:hypothetical protein KHQ89_05540 [Mycoplasmatota bacterium]
MKKNDFFKDGIFDWQTSKRQELRNKQSYNEKLYWGGFTKDKVDESIIPEWAIGPFQKYHEPIFEPDYNSWDKGHMSGGVHNGSIIKKDNKFYYIYRGEMPHELIMSEQHTSPIEFVADYICDIGVAISNDGIHFERLAPALFRHGEDEKYSFEDVCCVKKEDTYYLFCNRWNFKDPINVKESGVVLSTSKDLIHWTKPELIFKEAREVHRNACVLQNPENEAVLINNEYIMYLNNFLIAKSKDLINWTSHQSSYQWPGGEGCFAVTDYQDNDNIILFTGGHHSGYFYAIGEVLFSKLDVTKPIDYLNRPILKTDDRPYENGYDYKKPDVLVSAWKNTIFFTGMTKHDGKWMCYYGGSEYYTCLAYAKDKREIL